MINYRFIHYSCLESTNSEIKTLYHQGASEGTIVTATHQTAGRGRLNRKWISPKGNLYFTLLLTPKIPMESLGQLSLVVGIALAKTIQQYVKAHQFPVSLKWPNDVMVGGKKNAGILIETDLHSKTKIPCYVGVGVNIQSAPDLVDYPTIALKEGMNIPPPSPLNVLQTFISQFDLFYPLWLKEGFINLRQEWLSLAYGLGEMISVHLPKKGHIKGTFTHINEKGNLCVVDKKGQKYTLSTAEIIFS